MKNGILFDQTNQDEFVDKILIFYKKPEEYIAIARSGREYVISTHLMDYIVNQILAMYKTVVTSYYANFK